MSRWWRAYDEAVDDPKLQKLAPPLFKSWFNLMCIASIHGGFLPPIDDVAFKLRVSKLKAELTVSALVAAGLIDEVETGKFAPHNWTARQFQSDVSTDRVKRFRNARRNVSPTVSETPPETETETETEKKNPPSGEARKRATRLSKDWWPSLEDVTYAQSKGLSEQRISVESEKFRNYWTAKGGKDAAKFDWHATWQNWILKAMEIGNGHAKPGPKSLAERSRELAEQARELERATDFGRPDEPVRGH